MADIRISELPAASAGAGSDLFATTQGSTGPGTGTTKKISTSQILASPPAIGSSTPGAGTFTTLEATGVAKFSSQILAATGTTQGAAAGISSDYVVGTTAASQTGIRLPSALPGSRKVVSASDANGGNDLLLYPAVGEELFIYTIGGLGGNTPQLIGANEAFVFECTAAGKWYGFQIS